MGNMSYCRFRNTLSDLRDCYDNMDEIPDDPEEARARKGLIRLCMNIAGDYCEILDDD